MKTLEIAGIHKITRSNAELLVSAVIFAQGAQKKTTLAGLLHTTKGNSVQIDPDEKTILFEADGSPNVTKTFKEMGFVPKKSKFFNKGRVSPPMTPTLS